jgi:hypothetical protein
VLQYLLRSFNIDCSSSGVWANKEVSSAKRSMGFVKPSKCIIPSILALKLFITSFRKKRIYNLNLDLAVVLPVISKFCEMCPVYLNAALTLLYMLLMAFTHFKIDEITKQHIIYFS